MRCVKCYLTRGNQSIGQIGLVYITMVDGGYGVWRIICNYILKNAFRKIVAYKRYGIIRNGILSVYHYMYNCSI